MNNIPEKFLSDDGTLNTDALIKSYTELEKKIGTMVSVPNSETDEKSRLKFNRAIGVPDSAADYPKNDLYDDENLRQKFFDIGLTKNQVQKIYEIADEFLSPVISDLFSTRDQNNAIAELKTFFGGTEKMTDALRAINAFGTRFLPHEAFEVLCSSAQGIQSIYKMMQSMEPDVKTDKNEVVALTEKDLRQMMQDPKYWRDKDTEYIRKIENGFKKLYS